MSTTAPIHHPPYLETLFTSRFIRHPDLKAKTEQIKGRGKFKVELLGRSVQGREIYHLSIGTGKTSILLWSQMHGDEPTGTLAFFDLFNFFAADDEHNQARQQILDSCTLHFVPMLNPDGAAMHQRRNAQQIDMNRDFLKQQTPEARLLISLHQNLKPEFCFNMHDQETLWSVAGSKKPAVISLLAPPVDSEGSLPTHRLNAMLVIAAMHQVLLEQISASVGRWSDEYESRAFGDNFQKLGSSTILVEAGGYDQDFEKQYVRKLTFDILLQAFAQIATEQYKQQSIANYHAIPLNSRELFHALIKNCKIEIEGTVIIADIGLNYTETVDPATTSSINNYTIADIGDLSTWNAYDIFEADKTIINTPVKLGNKAHFKIKTTNGRILIFKDGTLI